MRSSTLAAIGDKNMARKRDWVDYTNLASNVAQNFQLHHVNHTLAGRERNPSAPAAAARAVYSCHAAQVEVAHNLTT
jgi:hypothetical protein